MKLNITYKQIICFFIISAITLLLNSCSSENHPEITPIAAGWAKNSINSVIFRSNSIVSSGGYQFVAFYDSAGNVILAKRKSDSEKWNLHKTKYKGDIKDAHKSISIMIDGEQYLHMSWDQHNNQLRYCRSKSSGRFELTEELSMTGLNENNVSYPQFYRMPDGNLIFMYRDGSSGNGNMVINYYEARNQKWKNIHRNLIDGEGERNAYWQAFVDDKGVIHISWVWRENPDVASNHDICYARSTDNGKTWAKSTGEKYNLPITAANAEYAAKIPQRRELINQTSMYADKTGNIYIVNYWTPEETNIPQYHLVYFNGKKWETQQVTERKKAFSLSGEGTKKIPISRPQVLADKKNVYVIFRDAEFNNYVTAGICTDVKKNNWTFQNLTSFPVGMWEPTYDTELWKEKKELNLFIQNTGQGDAETLENIPPQMISVLEWKPDE